MEKPPHILVVDHSKVTRTTLTRLLHKELGEIQLHACGSGGEALAYLQASPDPDLITTSLDLEDMDGLALIRKLREAVRSRNTPIVVVSGDAEARFAKGIFAAGVTNFFDKSGGYVALIDFIRNLAQRNFVQGRVLYLEDDFIAAKATQHILERNGLDVMHCTSAEQALALLRTTATDGNCDGHSGDTFFDILVADFYLKGPMTAANLLHSLRVKLRYSAQELPVLVITGQDNADTQIEAFRAGANDFVTKPCIEEVLITRIRSLLLIKQQFDALHRQAEEMHRLAITDPLTGVRNRQYMLDVGGDFLQRPTNHPVAVLILDIDRFKSINDTYGHLVGDRVLKGIGKALMERLPTGAIPIRFGGEEFCALLPTCSRAKAIHETEQLRLAMAQVPPENVPVSASIGVVSTQEHPDMDLNNLIALADKALYAAKKSGRNRVCVYSKHGIVPASPERPCAP